MVDAYKDFGTLSTIFWFRPVTRDVMFQLFPSGILVEIDTEMEKLEMDNDIPYLSTKSLFGGVSKEFCQLFKYALYK